MSLGQYDLEQDCINSIEQDNLERVKQFVTNVFSLNSFLRSSHMIWDTNCFSVLSIAAFYGSRNCVEYLLQKNAHVNQVDSLKNRTALHWAVASGNLKIVQMLIDAGALVNAIDRDSITPLILAANLGDLDIAKVLIQNGAKLNHKDRMNSTALHYACLRSHWLVAHELIKHGCSLNTNTPFSFSSPLKYLTLSKNYSIAKSLVETGCDLSFEKWMFDDAFVRKYGIDQEFVTWLRNYAKNPPKLAILCRKQIRDLFGNQNLADKVHSLNSMPKILKQYLLMKI